MKWILAFALLVALPAFAGNSAIVTLKTAQYSLTKQVKDPATGTTKTVTVGRRASFVEIIELAKAQPPGAYRIVAPSPYVQVVACPAPADVAKAYGVCLDALDQRFIPWQTRPWVEEPTP